MKIEKLIRNKRLWIFFLAAVFMIMGTNAGAGAALAQTGMSTIKIQATGSNSSKQISVVDVDDGTGPGFRTMTGSNAKAAAPEYKAVQNATGSNGLQIATESNALWIATRSNADMQEIICNDAEGISVSVFIPQSIELPENVHLVVRPIDKDGNEFCTRFEQFREKWVGVTSELSIYNIGFYDEYDNEIEVSNQAMVTIRFQNEPLYAGDGLAVIHFKGLEPNELQITDVIIDDEKMVSELTFMTESFSDFGFLEHCTVPVTGGPGTSWYAIAGMLLIGVGVLYKLKKYLKGGLLKP